MATPLHPPRPIPSLSQFYRYPCHNLARCDSIEL